MAVYGDVQSVKRLLLFGKVVVSMISPIIAITCAFAGSFFSKSKLSLQKWLELIFWWSREHPVTQTAIEVGCKADTAVDVYQWLREVCSTYLCNQTIVLGGPGVVVQIDESLFSHKPKVRLFARGISLHRPARHGIVSATNSMHICCRIIGVVVQLRKYGYLELWTHHTLQHLVITIDCTY